MTAKTKRKGKYRGGRPSRRGSYTGVSLDQALRTRSLTRDRFAELTGRVPNSIQAWIGRKTEKGPLWLDRWFELYDAWISERGRHPDDEGRILKYLESASDVTYGKIAGALEMPDSLVEKVCEEMIEDGRLEH